MRSPVHRMVLDNEAVQALMNPHHRRHRSAVAIVQIGVRRNQRDRSYRIAVPTTVRVEAGWDRRDAGAAAINRLDVVDVGLDVPAADRAASLRSALAVSVSDAHLGIAMAGPGPVSVVTSDVEDVRRMAAHLDVRVDVVPL